MRLAAGALGLAVLTAACGSTDADAAGPAASTTRVGLIDWEITTAAQTLQSGPVTLDVTNAGATEHDLRVSGERVDAATPVLAPGEQATLVVDLDGESRVLLWCSVPGHRAQGMERRLPVTDRVDQEKGPR